MVCPVILRIGIYYRMKKCQLGEFEEVVMLTMGVLHEEGHGVSIKNDIETRLNRNVSVGALQSALKRLENKGYLRSKEGESTAERVGRSSRYSYMATSSKRALEFVRNCKNSLSDAIRSQVILDLKIAYLGN